MTSQKIPSGKKDQAVLFYSGAIGTTVFQVQDSTGSLGGTYTVNVVAQ
jgi:fibrillarin-like rRNA methylase